MRNPRRWLRESPYWTESLPRRAMIAPYVLIAGVMVFSVLLVAWRFTDRADTTDFKVKVNTYITEASTYVTCVNRSQSRDELREAITVLFDKLSALASRLGAADIAADLNAAKDEFLKQYEPIPIATCGDPPVPPDGVTPIPTPTTTTAGTLAN